MDITLYPGLAFSPQAELSEGVGAADTILKVSDSSRFPPPPNLATIGTDEDGETVLYTALAEGHPVRLRARGRGRGAGVAGG